MKKNDKRAGVYFNSDFFEIITFSIGMLGYAEPEAPPHYLEPDVDDAVLGATLRVALAASKRVTAEEFQNIFASGVVQELGTERAKAVMKKHGYKTKRAMYKNMDNCSVDVVDEGIKIQPMHHKSLGVYSATADGPQPIEIDVSVTDAELGAALREGFKRCTSAVN
jgi:hypothetical protein